MPSRSEVASDFDQLPAGVVGAADVTHLAGADEVVEGAQGFVEGRQRVEVVGLIEVDVIRTEAAQAILAGFDDVAAGESGFVGARLEAVEDLGGQDDLLAAGAQRLAENLLGLADRIDIGGVEKIDAAVDADFDEAARLLDLHVAHRGKASFAAEGHRAETQDRNFKTAGAQESIFHGSLSH